MAKHTVGGTTNPLAKHPNANRDGGGGNSHETIKSGEGGPPVTSGVSYFGSGDGSNSDTQNRLADKGHSKSTL